MRELKFQSDVEHGQLIMAEMDQDLQKYRDTNGVNDFVIWMMSYRAKMQAQEKALKRYHDGRIKYLKGWEHDCAVRVEKCKRNLAKVEELFKAREEANKKHENDLNRESKVNNRPTKRRRCD